MKSFSFFKELSLILVIKLLLLYVFWKVFFSTPIMKLQPQQFAEKLFGKPAMNEPISKEMSHD